MFDLPQVWGWKKTDQIFTIGAGITLGPGRVLENSKQGYLRVANVRRGAIDLADVSRMEASKAEVVKYSLREGDLLVVEGHANPEEIGRCAIVGENASGLLYQNHLFRLRSVSAVPKFGEIWLNSPVARTYWRRMCATSSGLYTINSKMLGALPFPEVSYGEQRRIVEVIDAFEETVQAGETLVRKFGAQMQGLIESLLRDQIDSESVLLGSALQRIDAGWSPMCEETPPAPGEWGVLKVSAVTSGRFIRDESKVLPAGFRPRPELQVNNDDLLMCRANGVSSLVGKVALVKGDSARLMLSDKILRLVPDRSKTTSAYLAIVLASSRFRRQIDALLSGSSGQKNISQGFLRSIKIDLPSLEFQEKAVAAVSAIESSIDSNRILGSGLLVQKEALAEDLLSGRVRV